MYFFSTMVMYFFCLISSLCKFFPIVFSAAGIEGQIQRETNPGHMDNLYYRLETWLGNLDTAVSPYNPELKSKVLDRQYFFLKTVLRDWIFGPVRESVWKNLGSTGTAEHSKKTTPKRPPPHIPELRPLSKQLKYKILEYRIGVLR